MTDLRRSGAGAWTAGLILCGVIFGIGLMVQIAHALPAGTTGNCSTRCMEELAAEKLTAAGGGSRSRQPVP